MTSNNLKNLRMEFHILQSFPVTCLNRDDVGSPKTAMVGGTVRARVSSQAWKRPVRMAMHELGVTHGTRTKFISPLIAEACLEIGATPEQAKACGNEIENLFIKKKEENKKKEAKKTAKKNESEKEDELEDIESLPEEDDSEKSDTLVFLSPNEVSAIANLCKSNGFSSTNLIKGKDRKEQAKELGSMLNELTKSSVDAVDVALFGRMVAQASKLTIESAASFSHAISTHKVNNEVEFFTALDDCQEDPGAAHMGSLEFNSATYYRYVSLDLGQLAKTLAGHGITEAVETFVQALFTAVPAARQATQSGASPWAFAKVLVRSGQRLQIPFETAIKGKDGGFLQPSIEFMTEYLAKQEKMHGSLFGKQSEYTYGQDENFTIDHLITELKRHASVYSSEV